MSPRRHAPVVRTVAPVGVLVSVLAGLLLALAPSAWAQPADDLAAAATCNGRTPTMDEGSPGETILGTAGDDVIITGGAARVDTGAGDDSICITGKGPAIVNAGPGDDFVGARAHQGKTFVSLGFGDDRFIGGDGPDRVWSQESSNQTSSDDSDTILTYGGDDYVISGSSTALNTDIVALGTGDDGLVTYGFSSGAVLSGGPGSNSYQPLPGPGVSGSWDFDNVEGQATLDEVTRLTWRGFQRFDLAGVQGDRLRFRGSKASETVSGGGACEVVLRGRAGNDRLTVDDEGCNGLPAGDALLVGGGGDDVLKGAGGDDVLRGGGGGDSADGGAGDDRCLAESRVNC
jgi:Ca2+-binding RTX toxin-like protein